MHILGQKPLGIAILLLLALLVVVKRLASGSILDRPAGRPFVQLVNVFNLFFLLLVNPAAAVLLILGSVAAVDPAHISIESRPVLVMLEGLGLLLYASGILLMAWGLGTLGRSYQLGGLTPRPDDGMVTGGPYRLVRHPMYAAVLSISLGLAFLLQSGTALLVFAVYLGLIWFLVPIEEAGLGRVYGEAYAAYRRKTGRVVPFVR
jgi:protein-S-isoprenylcysteine O-methyltransferase Ste14